MTEVAEQHRLNCITLLFEYGVMVTSKVRKGCLSSGQMTKSRRAEPAILISPDRPILPLFITEHEAIAYAHSSALEL